MDASAVGRLLNVYEEISRQTAALKAMTELCCPPGCGACCSAPEAEATELEMLPVARELCRRQEALSWFERLGAAATRDRASSTKRSDPPGERAAAAGGDRRRG
jgi:hypothetical protein